jgi:hypothetical protein
VRDQELKEILRYREAGLGQEFVDGVMQGVRRQRLNRRLILLSFGIVGAIFGLVGATMLSDSITRLFTADPGGTVAMQVVLSVVAAFAFYTWFMNDDLSVSA